MLPVLEVLRCGGEVRMSQFANGTVGVGREQYVADPLTCTPPRKIRAQFHVYKHTLLSYLVGQSSRFRGFLAQKTKVVMLC
jgi:hypothetical protein